MKMSLSWLRRYVDITVPVEELCEKMIMSGFEVESIEDLSATMSRVVVGRIVKLEKHPDADKLQICQMDVGEEALVQIVTGADNVFEGALVPAALHDSHLPNGMHIKAGKLRGVESRGMLCSGEELALKEADYPGAEVHGILILQGEWKPGTDMREVLRLMDTVIDFKITANRPDCQSVLGVAREVAVALNVPFCPPVPTYRTAAVPPTAQQISVEVRDSETCPRYIGRVVNHLRVAPSPEWMQDCLKAAGMRPINNIVDITNFVMLETGQPMHAFDMRDVAGHKIIVRRAEAGETITTLDEKTHELTAEMLVIADEKQPSCLAGIMGGENSGIKPDTVDLFLECAKFRRDSVRRTARALGMRTESSARFEKGVDICQTAYAMDRALQLIDELDAGDIAEGVLDCCDALPEERVLQVSAESITALLGVDVPTETMVDILNRLEVVTTEENGVLTCRVPSFRDDIEGRADLAEEVMRVYGYDHITATPMTGTIERGKLLPERAGTDKMKDVLIAQGMREIATYSFVSAKTADQLSLAADDPRRQTVTLLNPLGEEYSTMRTQMISSMLTVLATNYSRKNASARLFEISRLFRPKQLPLTEQPEEIPALSLGAYGEAEDFFTFKGIVETLMKHFGVAFTVSRSAEPFLHPGRQAAVSVNGEVIGVFGEVHPDTVETFGMAGRVYVGQLLVWPILSAAEECRVIYKPLPRFPAIERDLALVCDDDLPVAEIEDTIRKAGGRYLESVRLFDVYRGAQIADGQKSVAYRLQFRSADATLTDAEIDPALNKIFKKLKEKGCILRT